MSQAFYTDTQQRQVWRVFGDVVRHRALLRDLVSKEFRAHYRNTIMGVLWAVLHPLLMMLILAFVFGILLDFAGGRIAPGARSYAVFLLCGLVPWQFLASALMFATESLLINQELIKKVYFPREVIPLSAVINRITNLAIGFLTLLAVMMALEGPGSLGLGIVWVPLVFAIQLGLVVGLALLFSSLNVFYRDVRFMVEIALAFGFYATPIFYDISKIQNALHSSLYRLYMLNPMAHLVEAYRQALMDNRFPDMACLLWPALFAALALATGIYVFRRQAPFFADFF